MNWIERVSSLNSTKGWEQRACVGSNSLLVYTIVFFSSIAVTIIVPVMPFVMYDMGEGAGAYGMLQSTLSVTQTVASVLIGYASDIIGLERTICMSLVVSCGGQFLLFASTSMRWMLISRFVGGCGFQIVLLKAFFASGHDLSDDKRVKQFGVIGAIQGLSLGFGPLVGGVLSVEYGNRSVLFASFAFYGCAFVVSCVWWLTSSITTADRTQAEKKPLVNNNTDQSQVPDADDWKLRLGMLLVLNLMFRVVFACYKSNFAFLCKENMGYGPREVGFILSFVGFYGVVVQGVLSRLATQMCPLQHVLMISMLIISCSIAGMALSNVAWSLMPAVVLCATGYGLSLPVFSAMLSNFPAPKGKLMGLAGMIDRSGQALGSVVGGMMVDFVGSRPTLGAAAASLVFTSGVFQSTMCVRALLTRCYGDRKMGADGYEYNALLSSENDGSVARDLRESKAARARWKRCCLVLLVVNMAYSAHKLQQMTRSYPNPEAPFEFIASPERRSELLREARALPAVHLTDVDVNWLQVIGEGWAAPLRGFMRESTLLQTLHFKSILVDTSNVSRVEATDWDRTTFPETRVSMSIPIVLPIDAVTKDAIDGRRAVSLVSKDGRILAVLRDPEVYPARRDELIAHTWGAPDSEHPYLKHALRPSVEHFVGGEVELVERIRYNDGLDEYRHTAPEVERLLHSKGADVVFSFQTRNPTHAGHAFLMKQSRERLIRMGYRNPVLWLSPLGGWTKASDVPLDVRVRQHLEVIRAGELNETWTLMSIWPAPMMYAGPSEVQFHAKSRRVAGAKYFTVGRDPAGLPFSSGPRRGDDIYHPEHGRHVLSASPGLRGMEFLGFDKVYYDKRDNTMKPKDKTRPNDFVSISGTKMRKLAAQGARPCAARIPSDLVKANCVPPGFMVPGGWKVVSDYYMNADKDRWVPYSKLGS